MNLSACQRAEVLAGAIALGEASDNDRETYRSHLSGCESCVRSLGGELSIERAMATVAGARDEETWDPDLSRLVRNKMNAKSRALGWSVGAVAACIAVSLAIHAAVIGGVSHLVASTAPQYSYSAIQPVSLYSAPKPQRSVAVVSGPQHTHMVVVHNVVTLSRPVAAPVRIHPAAPQRVATVPTRSADAPYRASQAASGVPVWRQGGGAVGSVGRAVVNEPNATTIGTIAIAPGYAMREAAPVGGENAINPEPAPIAYAEGAQGTTVFEVLIDERGAPSKCTITRSSGYLALDVAVCKAAMAAHYTPRMVGGHAVPGVYDDAFTFRQSDDDASKSI